TETRKNASLRIAKAGKLHPTLCFKPETKNEFYDNHETLIRNIPIKEQLILLGDFNARVGADHDSWSCCLGHYGIGKINKNGQRLLELCSYHDFCLTNYYFQSKPKHKVGLLIIIRCRSLRFVLLTRTYHSADCDTDHLLVCCKFRMQPKKIHYSKPEGKPCLDINKMQDPEKVAQFAKSMDEALKVTQNGDSVTDTLVRMGKGPPRTDFFEAKSDEMNPVIEAKGAALMEHRRSPRGRSLQMLRAARRKVQQTARWCSNEYWQELCEDIKTAAATGDIGGMYDGIKKVLSPAQNKTVPQILQWVNAEHYSELYSRENTAVGSGLDASQGCILAPALFGIFLSVLWAKACSRACTDFRLTISIKKTKVLCQDMETSPAIIIDNYELEAVHQFIYLGSTISDNLSLDAVIRKCIGKAATTLEDGQIPKDILYAEIASGKRTVGPPQLRFKDVCKRDMRALDTDITLWEDTADDLVSWRGVLRHQLKIGEEKILRQSQK
ncbi:CFDP2 protein, partial [Atractosteus spatula]|nr:CFDP2 protein [Atractosteus spatula]